MRGLFVALCCTLALASMAPAKSPAHALLSVAAVDAHVVVPKGAPKGNHYVKYYLLKTIRSNNDLPFSSMFSFQLREPREVWLALFIQLPSVFTSGPPGLHVVKDARTFPQVVHGGCAAVNVIVDASTGATLASWCNGSDSGPHRPLPIYIPRGSPIQVR